MLLIRPICTFHNPLSVSSLSLSWDQSMSGEQKFKSQPSHNGSGTRLYWKSCFPQVEIVHSQWASISSLWFNYSSPGPHPSPFFSLNWDVKYDKKKLRCAASGPLALLSLTPLTYVSDLTSVPSFKIQYIIAPNFCFTILAPGSWTPITVSANYNSKLTKKDHLGSFSFICPLLVIKNAKFELFKKSI